MDPIDIALTKDEALVLFEFLSRYAETDRLNIEDSAEQQALWNLTCLLEKALTEPFSSNQGGPPPTTQGLSS